MKNLSISELNAVSGGFDLSVKLAADVANANWGYGGAASSSTLDGRYMTRYLTTHNHSVINRLNQAH